MELKISNLINEELIELELNSDNKPDVIVELVDLLDKSGKLKDKSSFLNTVLEREKLGSTGIGKEIAIPHGKSDEITDVVLVFGRSTAGIEFYALDDKPVKLFFLLAAPKNVGGVYLKALAQLSRLLRQQEFRENLLNAREKPDVLEALLMSDLTAG